MGDSEDDHKDSEVEDSEDEILAVLGNETEDEDEESEDDSFKKECLLSGFKEGFRLCDFEENIKNSLWVLCLRKHQVNIV